MRYEENFQAYNFLVFTIIGNIHFPKIPDPLPFKKKKGNISEVPQFQLFLKPKPL